MGILDNLMSRFDVLERHEIRVFATSEQAYAVSDGRSHGRQRSGTAETSRRMPRRRARDPVIESGREFEGPAAGPPIPE